MATECIIWDGTIKPNGKGVLYPVLPHGERDRHGTRYAHRDAYIAEHGNPPDGFHIHHVCGESLCVNTKHLVALSATDHGKLHGQLRANTCQSGHPWTEESLSWQDGKRLCRICRNDRMREWSRTHRDAEYWREYRRRKVEESGAASYAEYKRWRKAGIV